jgi:hypothetical protein
VQLGSHYLHKDRSQGERCRLLRRCEQQAGVGGRRPVQANGAPQDGECGFEPQGKGTGREWSVWGGTS